MSKKLRCMYCGQFIKHSDFENDKAVTDGEIKFIDTMDGPEEYEDFYQYHIVCRLKEEGEPK